MTTVFPSVCYLRCAHAQSAVLFMYQLQEVTLLAGSLYDTLTEVVKFPGRWTLSCKVTHAIEEMCILFQLTTIGGSVLVRTMTVAVGSIWSTTETIRFLDIVAQCEQHVATHCLDTLHLQFTLDDLRARIPVVPYQLFWPLWGIVRWAIRVRHFPSGRRLYFSDTISVYYQIVLDVPPPPQNRVRSVKVELTYVYQDEEFGTGSFLFANKLGRNEWDTFREWGMECANEFYKHNTRYAIEGNPKEWGLGEEEAKSFDEFLNEMTDDL